MKQLVLNVNGSEVRIGVEPHEMLSNVLRSRLGLTGTKIGCDEAECGSCTVLVNGRPMLACTLPALRTHGAQVVTIEGLEAGGELHPLQEAFVAHGAVQCGFCIPGQIMTAAALLQENPEPSPEQIQHALKDTLCRCGGYPTIIRAIEDAGHALRADGSIQGPELAEQPDTTVIGRTLPRPDAVAKVRGTAKFADDYTFPGMLHGRTKRALTPHGILRGLDVERARALPGVHTVITAADLQAEINHGLVIYDWPTLIGVGEHIRYVGDALALVAAETREQADAALALIEAQIEPLPGVYDPVQARAEDAPPVHSGGNLLKHIKVRKGDPPAGFDQAEITLEETYWTASTEHAYIEPECSLARPLEDGRLEVYVGSQIPYADRSQIARCLGIPEEDVRVVGTLIGGGFGGKEDIAGQIHAALLAQSTGRPVKILYDRHESLLVHPKRHATQIRVRVGASREGRITAVETELFGDTGAYASLGEKVMTRATTHSTGPYVIPHVKADCYAMYTNNPPAGAFRGFGVTQSCFAIESMMDTLARTLDLDPVDLRRRNALRIGSLTNTGQLLTESVGLVECLDRTVELMHALEPGGDPFEPKHVPGAPDLRRSWGLALAFKNTGLGGGAPDKASAEIELYTDGRAEVRTSSAELGQGLVTVLQMIAAEELGMPPDAVEVLLSDTDLTPDGGPTTASRQTYVTGNAVRYAAGVVRQALATTLAEKYDCPPEGVRFVEGLAQVNGVELPLGEAVGMMKSEGREPRALYEYWAPETQPLGTGGDMHFAYSFAAQAAEVEVDLKTGEVRVLKVIAANDVGRTINPLGLLGQIEGGVMMGLGNALTEAFIVEEGQVFTDRMARYRIPSIVHTPEIYPIVVEHPTSEGPFGAKGIGEISSIPTTPAITNAIFNACGVRIRSLPADQDWLARQLSAGEG
jgi:xanthine dehydrogenase molybdenum-binding subunit